MTLSAATASKPVTLRQQVNALPAYVLAAWRTRYATSDTVDLQARALLDHNAWRLPLSVAA